MSKLPTGCKIIAVKPHGSASWSAGYKVDAEVAGEKVEYFLKVYVTSIIQRQISADDSW